MNFIDTCHEVEREYKIIQDIFPKKDQLYTHQQAHVMTKQYRIFQSKFGGIAERVRRDKRMTPENKSHILNMIGSIVDEISRVKKQKIPTSDKLSDSKDMLYDHDKAHSYDDLLYNFFNNYYKGEDLKKLHRDIQNMSADTIADVPKDDLLSIINQLIIIVYDPKDYKIMSERKVRAIYKIHHDYHVNLKIIVWILNGCFGFNYTVIELMRMSSAYFVTFGQEEWLDKVGRYE